MRDFEVVRLFLKIVECRSLVGAARALGLPRSSVSRKLADLEADVGARLVQRSTRSFGLTEAGMQVHAQFERIAEATVAIEEAVGTRGVQGLLRVTAPISFAQAMIAPVIPAFLRAHPDVRIQLDATTRRVDLIAEEFDVAIRAGRVQDSALVSRRLGASAMALCASPGYLAAEGPVESVRQLAGQTVIAFNPSGEPPKSWTLTQIDRSETVPIAPRLIVNDNAIALAAALDGFGIACLPRRLCTHEIEAGRLVPLLAEWHHGEAEVWALYPSRRALTPKVRAFVDHLVATLTF